MYLKFLLFSLLMTSGLCGQTVDSVKTINRLQFGVHFGVMEHEVEFTPSRTVEALQGNSFGVALRHFDNKLVGFQAELSYVQAGWKENIDPDFATLYERSVSYAELLILTQVSIGKGTIQPLLQAGPYVSFPLSDSEKIPEDYVDPGGTLPQTYGLDFPSRINYGARVGVGLNVELGPLTLQLDGRYLAGFSDLFKNGETVVATSRRGGLGGHVALFYTFFQGGDAGAKVGK